MLGKFQNENIAKSYSARTEKASAIVLGDDGKYWVVTLAKMQELEKLGYESI